MTTATFLRHRHVTVYVTSWCYSSRRTLALLERLDVPHVRVDIEQDAEAMQRVEDLNGGYRSVPTIVVELVLTKPSNEALQSVLLDSGARLLACTVYVGPDCPTCETTLDWFRDYRLACHPVDVTQDPLAASRVREWSDSPTPLPIVQMTLQLTEPTSDQLQAAVGLGA
ncbi:MAG: glutaredoxin domain-containing protein [Anaerolineae bacterium]